MRCIPDLPYRQPAAERQSADLYLPDAAVTAGDCLVWAHGGGLSEGSKSCEDPLQAHLTAAGFAVCRINYRLLQHAPWPACLEDVAAAVAWAPAALAAHGFACRRLFLGGMSAGAYLAAMVGLDRRWLAAYGEEPSRLAGVIALSGQMTSHFAYRVAIGHPADRPLIDHAAPLWHVRPDAPPLLLIAGSDDIPCRPEENRLMEAAMRHAGHRHTACHIIPDRNHGTIFFRPDDSADEVTQLFCAFLGIPAPAAAG